MCEKRLRAALRVHLSGDITMFSVSTQSCLAICRVNRARGSGPPPLLARRLPTHPASWMAPQFWGSVVFVLHLERLPGPGARVHVQQPGILEQLQEKRPQQGSGAAQAMNHARRAAAAKLHCRSQSAHALQEAGQAPGPRSRPCVWPLARHTRPHPGPQLGVALNLPAVLCVCTDREGRRRDTPTMSEPAFLSKLHVSSGHSQLTFLSLLFVKKDSSKPCTLKAPWEKEDHRREYLRDKCL